MLSSAAPHALPVGSVNLSQPIHSILPAAGMNWSVKTPAVKPHKLAAQTLIRQASGQQDVSLMLFDNPDGSVDLMSIWTLGEPRCGAGSRVLRRLTQLADQLEVTLRLNVHWLTEELGDEPLMRNGLLEKWYIRNGFVRTPECESMDIESGEVHMVRLPR